MLHGGARWEGEQPGLRIAETRGTIGESSPLHPSVLLTSPRTIIDTDCARDTCLKPTTFWLVATLGCCGWNRQNGG